MKLMDEKIQKLLDVSPPVWGRGLKSQRKNWRSAPGMVAPGVGAWVEISRAARSASRASVAPGVGAWVEISSSAFCLADE